MKSLAILGLSFLSLLSNLSSAAAAIDCSKVNSEVAQAAIISQMKFENPPAEAAQYATAVQKQRQGILSKLGSPTTSTTSNEFGPGFLYVAIGYENGSISGVVSCSAQTGLKVVTGSYSSPKTGQFGNI